MADPQDCTTMLQVREGVDAVDRDIATLLARRFAYMDAAARIKTDRTTVRDEARKAQVLVNARNNATGYPPEVAAELWELLVERSIAYELEAFDRRGD
jgi:isochorismate pyruvate lyase